MRRSASPKASKPTRPASAKVTSGKASADAAARSSFGKSAEGAASSQTQSKASINRSASAKVVGSKENQASSGTPARSKSSHALRRVNTGLSDDFAKKLAAGIKKDPVPDSSFRDTELRGPQHGRVHAVFPNQSGAEEFILPKGFNVAGYVPPPLKKSRSLPPPKTAEPFRPGGDGLKTLPWEGSKNTDWDKLRNCTTATSVPAPSTEQPAAGHRRGTDANGVVIPENGGGIRMLPVPGYDRYRNSSKKMVPSGADNGDTVASVLFGQSESATQRFTGADFVTSLEGRAGKGSWQPEEDADDFVDNPRAGVRKFDPPSTWFDRLDHADRSLNETIDPRQTSARSAGSDDGRRRGKRSTWSKSMGGSAMQDLVENRSCESTPRKQERTARRAFTDHSCQKEGGVIVSDDVTKTSVEKEMKKDSKPMWIEEKEPMRTSRKQNLASEECCRGDKGVAEALNPPPPRRKLSWSTILPAPVPTIFVSHGNGPFPLLCEPDDPMAQSFASLAESVLQRVASGAIKTVLVVSAHWETHDGIEVTYKDAAQPQSLFYDYCGMPPELYRLPYKPLADPKVAQEAISLMQEAGLTVRANTTRRLDHGVFVPLLLMGELARLPVVQVSLPQLSKDWQQNARTAFNMGRALWPLRSKGVLIMGSGQATSTHRCQDDAAKFAKALSSTCTMPDFMRRTSELVNWRRSLPRARIVHSREEHLLPLLVAAGAAETELGTSEGDLWSGTLSVNHFRFGDASIPKSSIQVSPRADISPIHTSELREQQPYVRRSSTLGRSEDLYLRSKVSFEDSPRDGLNGSLSPSSTQDFDLSPRSARSGRDITPRSVRSGSGRHVSPRDWSGPSAGKPSPRSNAVLRGVDLSPRSAHSDLDSSLKLLSGREQSPRFNFERSGKKHFPDLQSRLGV